VNLTATGSLPHVQLGALLDLVDLVGDQAVGLAVHLGGGVGRGGLDQAEHSPGRLVDPVPQVVDVVAGLRLQVRQMSMKSGIACLLRSSDLSKRP